MVKQVKFVVGTDLSDLESLLNSHLAEIESEVSIQYDFDKFIAVIESQKLSPSHICCECKYWDDGGDHQALSGECHKCEKRKRYGDDACAFFEKG